MKSIKIIMVLCFCALCFISPACAYDVTYTPPSPPEVLPTYNPFEDDVMKTWINTETQEFDVWNIMTSVMTPYTMIFGGWVFVILYALYIWSVYSRANGIALMAISMGITLPIWYTLFPPSTWYFPVIIFALALAGILFRIFKRR